MVAARLLAMSLMVLFSESREFLPRNFQQDPADALADKLLKTAGFSPEERISLDPEERISPVAVKWNIAAPGDESKASGPSHGRLSPKDLVAGLKPAVTKFEAMVGSEHLSAPKAWLTPSPVNSDDSESISALSSLRKGMKDMFHDMANTPKSRDVADWSEYRDDSSESTKEVVRISQQDTVIHQPVHRMESRDWAAAEKSSLPAWVRADEENKLQSTFSAGLRWFKQPLKAEAETLQSDQAVSAVNTTELGANMQYLKEEHEDTDSLAKSLASEFPKRKKKEVVQVHRHDLPTGDEQVHKRKGEVLRPQRPHLPTGQEVHVKNGTANQVAKEEIPESSPLSSVHRVLLPTGQEVHVKNGTANQVVEEEDPESSALSSVHRGRRAKHMLPIKPEDVHQVAAPEPEEIEQAKPLKMLPEKRIPERSQFKPAPPVKAEPSVNDGSDDLFKTYAVQGFVDAKGMDAVLEDLGTKKHWNWKAFDLDGDGRLSQKEFANAAVVAQRFKAHKN